LCEIAVDFTAFVPKESFKFRTEVTWNQTFKVQNTMRKLQNNADLERIFFCLTAAALLATSGCSTPGGTAAAIAGGVVGTTLVGGQAPTHEIEQVYYLGVFDPHEQLPPTIYRLTVRGQASFLSSTKFATGWVPAQLIDSLNTHINFDSSNGGSEDLVFHQGDSGSLASLKPGRRLVMFGPEGFREAPRDHRLVMVMGANPQKFFEAVDEVLGQVSSVTVGVRNAALERKLFEALLTVKNHKESLDELQRELPAELKEGK
jgi:hypothetical protein